MGGGRSCRVLLRRASRKTCCLFGDRRMGGGRSCRVSPTTTFATLRLNEEHSSALGAAFGRTEIQRRLRSRKCQVSLLPRRPKLRGLFDTPDPRGPPWLLARRRGSDAPRYCTLIARVLRGY